MKKLSLFLIALAMILGSCKPEIEKPTVVTKSVGEITQTTAKIVGQVIADGGAEVTERGVCWNTSPAPEVIDYRTVDGSGIGTFNSNISDLVPNTQYYVRAYATNEKGTAYGEEVSFATKDVEEPEDPEQPEQPENPEDPEQPEQPEEPEFGLPIVATTEVTEIIFTTAKCTGEVIFDGNMEVIARGVCWSTSQNPTIEDNKTTDGIGVGSYTSNILDLVPNTQYYVRAYATNDIGTSYGEEISFTTMQDSGISKYVLLEDYVGVRCVNSPAGYDESLKLKEKYNNKVVVLNTHFGGLAMPIGGFPDFRTTVGDEWGDYFNVDATPTATINRKSKEDGTYIYDRSEWNDVIDITLQESAIVEIIPTVEYYESTRELKVDIKSKFYAKLSDTYALTICIVEDNIVGKQLSVNGNNLNYLHRYVFRGTINDIWGEELNTTTIFPEGVFEKSHVTTLSENFNSDQCYIVAFVSNAETKEILQVTEMKIK